MGEGIRNETVNDGHILLSLHHESFVGPDRIGEAVASLEKCWQEGWHKDFGPVPTIPCQCIPQGFVDQVTKLRGILNLAYPKGEVVEGLPKAVNERVDLSGEPDLVLSSGVEFARNVGILQTAAPPEQLEPATMQLKSATL